jgi:hypothetical protein
MIKALHIVKNVSEIVTWLILEMFSDKKSCTISRCLVA